MVKSQATLMSIRPDRQKYYAQQAAEAGQCAADLMRACFDIGENGVCAAAEFARDAGHYGLLALNMAEVRWEAPSKD